MLRLRYYANQNLAVAAVRFVIGYGGPLLAMVHIFDIKPMTWYYFIAPLPATILSILIATRGVDAILERTAWGKGYLSNVDSWIRQYRSFASSKGLSKSVYRDLGEALTFLFLSLILLFYLVALIGWIAGERIFSAP